MLGITFKENCPDVRNTKVVDILNTLAGYGTQLTIYDPWASPTEVKHEYGWESTRTLPKERNYSAVVLAVSHQEFEKLEWDKICKENTVIYDVKGILPRDLVDARL